MKKYNYNLKNRENEKAINRIINCICNYQLQQT